jgi:hypothetical protein
VVTGLVGEREPPRLQGHCHPAGTAAVAGRHQEAECKERASSMAHVIPGTPSRGRDLVLGFIAGALAVGTFHQVMVLILSSVGLIQSRVYAMRGVPPFGVPTILNQMFWGGLWGLLFAAVGDTLPRWPLLLLGFSFGVLGPVLASWFVVAPLKGTPIAAGWVPQRMLASLLINGFWGIGVALIYAGLRRWGSKPCQPQTV